VKAVVEMAGIKCRFGGLMNLAGGHIVVSVFPDMPIPGALSGEPVEVYSATCDHHWTLTKEQSEKLRKRLSERAS
jgi:hypothetical protein